jgi:hypothetical protein
MAERDLTRDLAPGQRIVVQRGISTRKYTTVDSVTLDADDGFTLRVPGVGAEPEPQPAGPVFPPITTLRTTTPPAWNGGVPDKGVPWTDPTFGTKHVRISDPNERHGYSRRQPWSPADGAQPAERYMVLEHGRDLLDGMNYAPIRTLSGIPSGPQWLDGHTLIGVSGNRLVTLNVETNVAATEFTFSGYAEVSMGGEGAPSDDRRWYALWGRRTAGGHDLIVYDRSTRTWAATPIGSAEPNWAGMTRQGKFAMVGYSVRGTGRYQGTELFSRTPLFLRRITENYSHSDPGIDVDGQEVLAMCGQEYPRLYLLERGGERRLTPMATAFGSSHVSCQGPPGFATYSAYRRDGALDSRAGTDQVFSAKFDGSGTGYAWGHMQAWDSAWGGEPYDIEPHAVMSPTGTRVAYKSTMHSGEVFTFVASAG